MSVHRTWPVPGPKLGFSRPSEVKAKTPVATQPVSEDQYSEPSKSPRSLATALSALSGGPADRLEAEVLFAEAQKASFRPKIFPVSWTS
jgi:hypothetical protein